MKRLALLWAVVLLGACGPSEGAPDATAGTSQETYTYPGCPEDSGGYCPRMLTYACAQRAIEQKYQSCSEDSDCVAAAPPGDDCTGHGSCGEIFVAAAQRTPYAQEAGAEAQRYCATALCRMSGQCAGTYVGACIQGRCTAVTADAGT